MFSSASVAFMVFTIILQDAIFVQATATVECPLYTECRPYRKCPALKDKLNSMSNKPYCNFHLRGTYVCCPIPQPPYYTEKDDTRASVKACKSYKPLRQCDKVPLIIGGEKAEAKEFPFMALLMYKTETTIAYYCGGVLISSKYVLTTAHCFVRNPKPNIVRLGELDYNTTQDDAQPIDFKFTYQLHANYNYSAKLNDIALVKLDGEVQFSDYILPACLPLPNTRDFPHSLAAGWGAVSESFSASSSHLLRVKLDGYPSDVCLDKIDTNSLYPLNTTMQLCAGSKDGKRDTCTGDSGGPLFVDHPDDEYRCLYLVLGLTSYSHGGCANKDFPAIYVRLSHYHDWIESIVWG